MPMIPVDTAVVLIVGPVVDDTDFKSLEEAIAYDAAGMDVSLLQYDGTSPGTAPTATAITLTSGGANDWAHIDGAYYSVEITAAQNDTLGTCKLRGIATGVLPFESVEYDVVPQQVYNSLVLGSANLSVDIAKISGDATAADNLEAEFDGTGYDPIRNATGTSAIQRVLDLIESQRGGHTVQGQTFYVDPVNGDTHANGARGGRSDPYSTVQDCHDNAVTDSAHDLIILVAGAAGQTTLTEDVALSKRYLQIRGPGRDFIWTRSGEGDTITITADGIGLSGFQVETAATGSGRGIEVSGADFFQAFALWINDTQGDGIRILDGSNCVIEWCYFQGSGQSGSGHGLVLDPTGGSVSRCVVRHNHFSNVAGDSVRIGSGTVTWNKIEHNQIWDSAGWGINVQGGNDALLAYNVLGNNASGEISDSGTDTVQINNEQWARGGVNKFTITLHTQTTGAANVGSVSMEIFDENDAVQILDNLTTDANGDVSVTLEAGDYNARMVKAGSTPAASPTPFIVSADGETINLTIDPSSVPASSEPNAVTISGNMRDFDTTVETNGTVTLTPIAVAQGNVGTESYLTSAQRSTTTDASGDWAFANCPVGGKAEFVGKDTSGVEIFRKRITIPAANAALIDVTAI